MAVPAARATTARTRAGLVSASTGHFERLREGYGLHRWTPRCAACLAVYIVWSGAELALAIPMFRMVWTGEELAPARRTRASPPRHRGRAGGGLRPLRPDRHSTPTAVLTATCTSAPECDARRSSSPCPTSGFGGIVTKPWGERKRTTASPSCRRCQARVNRRPRRPQCSRPRRPPLPGAGETNSRWNFVHLGSTAASLQQILPVCPAAIAARSPPPAACSPSRRRSTPRWTSRRVELVIDRDKVAALGLRPAQRGLRTSPRSSGGNFVNRFDLAGRSYKVIPQLQAIGRASTRRSWRTTTSQGRTASWCPSAPSPPS
jgi:multidrug efflux pump